MLQRSIHLSFAGSLACAVLIGCSGSGSPTVPPPDSEVPGVLPAVAGAPIYALRPGTDSLVGMFEVAFDLERMDATVTPIEGRAANAQPPQAISYDLDIDEFLQDDSFEITGLQLDGNGDLAVTFTHAHPFPAPDFTQPITALNRADLGYTGRLLILAEGDSDPYFDGDLLTDPALVLDADGYVNPGDLLNTLGLSNNTFPYVLLADDGLDNRPNAPNGGQPGGNYAGTSAGWQRSTIGDGNDWTGYDFLHGGQFIENAVTLSGAELATQTSIRIAILIKYTDPRGTGNRNYRFPPEPLNVFDFAYRLPFAALDCSEVTLRDPAILAGDVGATDPIEIGVRDWDVTATESGDADLSDDANPRAVQPGASGPPSGGSVSAPFLRAAPFVLTPTGVGSGLPANPVRMSGTLSNDLGAGAGNYFGMIEVIDQEDVLDDSAYHFGVDPVTLDADPARAIAARTYQALPIRVLPLPPIISAVNPSGTVGRPGAEVTFQGLITGEVTTYSWDFGGGATPNTSTEPEPTVILGVTGTYNATLVAGNDGGNTAPFAFEVTVDPTLPDPPIVQQVEPTGLLGEEGAPVTFSATATGIVTSWTWNFGGGALPNTSTEATPTVNLTTAGDYVGTVSASNAGGASDPVTFNFSVCLPTPVITDVDSFPPGPLGTPGSEITLIPAATNSPTSWNWSFGPEVDPPTSTEEQPTVILGCPGTFSGAVTATNDCGTSPPFAFVFTVETPTVPTWTQYAVDLGGEVGASPSMAVFNDRLAISYYDYGSKALQYARATTDTPISDADWALHTVDLLGADGGPGEATRLLNVGGLPVVTFTDDTNSDLRVAIGEVAEPSLASDWGVHVAYGGGIDNDAVGFYNNVIEYQGRLAVSQWNMTDTNLLLTRATVATPTMESHWTTSVVANPTGPGVQVGGFSDLQVLSNGRLIVAHYFRSSILRGLRMAVAQTATPIGTGDWTIHSVDDRDDDTTNAGLFTDLALFDGRPVATYWDANFAETGGFLRVSFATVDVPASELDWDSHTVDAGSSDIGRAPSLTALGGRLAVSHFNNVNDTLRMARATCVTPEIDTEWQRQTVDSSLGTGFWSSAVAHQGRLWIAYSDQVADDLYIAFPDGGW